MTNGFLSLAREATTSVEALLIDAARAVHGKVSVEGVLIARLLDREQRATHGLASLATYVESIRQLTAYAERMQIDQTLGESFGSKADIAQIAIRLHHLWVWEGQIASLATDHPLGPISCSG